MKVYYTDEELQYVSINQNLENTQGGGIVIWDSF